MAGMEDLRNISLFRNFSELMLKEFSGYFNQRSYGAGEVVFKEKSTGNTLYIIVSGEVVIEKAMDEEAREFKTLAVLSGGEFFGEMSVIEGAPRFAQARANAASLIYEMDRRQFFAFVKEHPETGISIFSEIMRTVFRRLQHTSNELTMLFDLSRLLLARHESPAGFFAAVMEEMRVYLEGSWNVRAYVYNVYSEEYEQVYSRETFKAAGGACALPDKPENGWLDETTYVLVCSSEGRRLAGAVFVRAGKVSPLDKNNLAAIFNTISTIAGSAIVNIEHHAEAVMLEKLKMRKNAYDDK